MFFMEACMAVTTIPLYKVPCSDYLMTWNRWQCYVHTSKGKISFRAFHRALSSLLMLMWPQQGLCFEVTSVMHSITPLHTRTYVHTYNAHTHLQSICKLARAYICTYVTTQSSLTGSTMVNIRTYVPADGGCMSCTALLHMHYTRGTYSMCILYIATCVTGTGEGWIWLTLSLARCM